MSSTIVYIARNKCPAQQIKHLIKRPNELSVLRIAISNRMSREREYLFIIFLQTGNRQERAVQRCRSQNVKDQLTNHLWYLDTSRTDTLQRVNRLGVLRNIESRRSGLRSDIDSWVSFILNPNISVPLMSKRTILTQGRSNVEEYTH